MVSRNIYGNIAAYIPKWIRASVEETDDADQARAYATPRRTTVLFLDFAGFTEITDRFAKQAEFGAEQLSELLNDCFTTLTDVVDAFGGDIVAFTGDGFLAAWDADDGARATHVAAQCALALQHAMEVRAQSSDVQIRQRISMDVGTVYYCRLGGHDGVWRYAVVGTPFENVGLAYRKAAIGRDRACARPRGANSPMIAKSREATAFSGCTGLRANFEVARPLKARRIESERFQSLVPAVVIDRLRMGSSKWLAEFRNVSVLCISFLGVDFRRKPRRIPAALHFVGATGCVEAGGRDLRGLDGRQGHLRPPRLRRPAARA